MNIDYYTAEAFTEHPFHGAQIAVVPKSGDLSSRQMQCIAAEINLSETVFVDEKENNAFSLRVFSPLKEVEFAGHPMIATGHVLASLGLIDLSESPKRVTFIQKTGSVEILVHGSPNKPKLIQFSLSVDAKIDHMVPAPQEIADSLGIDQSDILSDSIQPLLVTREQTYLIVPLKTFTAVRKAEFNQRVWNHSSASSLMISQILLFSEGTEEPQHDYHGRLLGPDFGIHEDPPIGSSIPAFTAYLANYPEYRKTPCQFSIERGTLDTRQSILNVEMQSPTEKGLPIKVGGPAISISKASMLVPELECVR